MSTKRTPVIAGNWKMNKTPAEAVALVEALMPQVADARCEVVVCPPTIDIPAVACAIKGSNIGLGAQNVHWEKSGAFTGETNTASLLEIGAKYVIVGHSERRTLFGDTDETVNLRARAALAAGLTPIICMGETEAQRENHETAALLKHQTVSAFRDMSREEAVRCIVAYEPIWAIGTGKTATPEDANATIALVRAFIRELYGELADAIRILYGGSMNAGNCAALMAQPEIDGGLIGGASLKPDDFAKIVCAGSCEA